MVGWIILGVIAALIVVILCLRKNGAVPLFCFYWQRTAEIFLSVEPQARQSNFIRRQQNTAQRGIVMLHICHGVSSSISLTDSPSSPVSPRRKPPTDTGWPRCNRG